MTSKHIHFRLCIRNFLLRYMDFIGPFSNG
jgi:hypothetical protein